MRQYLVPPDMKEKEKIVGGILTITQFGWLAIGVVIAAIIFVLFFNTLNLWGLIIAVPIGLAIGLPFAFYKKKELTLFQYLKLQHEFNKKQKQLPNRKGEYL